MDKYTALERLLTELEDFLRILDKENLSSAAILKKCLLSEILQMYIKSTSSGDEEYIYMNKVLVSEKERPRQAGPGEAKELSAKDVLTNGTIVQHSGPPQKSLPDLPPSKIVPEKVPVPNTKVDVQEGYYEEAEPYDASINEDGEPVSSSYESYDEDENLKKSAAQHQWPSTEASIELMKDALICAFLWRKKWLGQWAKQLCVIRDNRLLCYKSSKDHSPQLDISLVGCSVTHKEKQVRKKEHKLKITPASSDVIVLGMQSKDQALQWLKVIQDVSGIQTDPVPEISLTTPDTPRSTQNKGDVTDRYSAASESGSSTDGHPETTDVKEVKKKGTSGLKLSNLMNLGRKKSSSMESPEKSLETSNYLNVMINSQWKSRYCCVREGQLHFFQDRNKSKAAIQPVSLMGCDIIPQPTQDHLYSFRILHNGEELAMLEAKTSQDMGHWLGLLLSESGSKTDPEEFDYDYVDADRISCIVTAAKNSYFLMQRKFSEPNTYIDNPRSGRSQQDDLYDDVDVSDTVDEEPKPELGKDMEDHTYLDLLPARYFVHGAGMKALGKSPLGSPKPERDNTKELEGEQDIVNDPEPSCPVVEEVEPVSEEPPTSLQVKTESALTASPLLGKAKLDRSKMSSPVAIETKLGKNRTEAEARRFLEEKEKLERDREEIRELLAQLRKEKRELKETIANCSDKSVLVSLEERLKSKEEECKQRENQRVDLELKIVEVKENLRKAELGPVTLGTTVDPVLVDSSSNVKSYSPSHIPDSSPINSAMALKSRPLSIMTTGKGTVLQKAKEWEKKGAS
ncbi:actin filament-associated protein 1-like 2 isoform X2 [Hyperolius riggenbachi]|uniref:actin filament-associated protein 1-like 2 isoform X2 n=1 Tax=Hyperolius riggenbachi TaxID=752182 RepID=UPI0035A3C575